MQLEIAVSCGGRGGLGGGKVCVYGRGRGPGGGVGG